MVYLIHLAEPIGRARHYLGWARDAARRFEEHKRGRGGRLTAAARAKGIPIELVRVWPDGTRGLEARLRRRGRLSRHCPICEPEGSLEAR